MSDVFILPPRDCDSTRFDWILRKISTRTVVHGAMPVPRKSESSVHNGKPNPRAVASTGQSASITTSQALSSFILEQCIQFSINWLNGVLQVFERCGYVNIRLSTFFKQRMQIFRGVLE